MTRKPQQALTDRAIKAYRYLIRGIAVAEIAKIEQIPLRTVYWLIHEGGRLLGGELKMLAETGLLRELVLHHQERKRELWMLYSTTRQDRVKVTCLAQLAEEDVHLLDLAERMGIISQKGVSLNGETSWSDLVRRAQENRSMNQHLNQPEN